MGKIIIGCWNWFYRKRVAYINFQNVQHGVWLRIYSKWEQHVRPTSWLYPDLKPPKLMQGSTRTNYPQIVVYELAYTPANRMICHPLEWLIHWYLGIIDGIVNPPQFLSCLWLCGWYTVEALIASFFCLNDPSSLWNMIQLQFFSIYLLGSKFSPSFGEFTQ